MKEEAFNGRGNQFTGGCDPLDSPIPPGSLTSTSTGLRPALPTDRWVLGSTCGTLPSMGDMMAINPSIFSADTTIGGPVATNTAGIGSIVGTHRATPSRSSVVGCCALSGVVLSWFFYMKRPDIPATIQSKVSGLYNLLDRKYYFDDLDIKGFAAGGRNIGKFLWQKGDELIIDGVIVNGTANTIGRLAGVMRQIQTGYLYTYAFAMIIGLTMLLGWLIWLR